MFQRVAMCNLSKKTHCTFSGGGGCFYSIVVGILGGKSQFCGVRKGNNYNFSIGGKPLFLTGNIANME